jgi:outer membrane protein TolC
VLDEALKTTQAIYQSTSNRYEKGFLQKSDLLQVQVQVSTVEHQLAEARSNVQNASDYLSLLMDKPGNVIYQVDTALVQSTSSDAGTTVPMNRADFLAMQSAVNAHDKMIQSGKMGYVPKLNGFAEYLINDSEAFGFGSDAYLVGAQLSWTIFNGSATRNKIAEHRAERSKSAEQLAYQKDQAQLELNKTIRQRDDALVMITQQDLAVQQASEALRILQNRHAQGLVTTTDLLQSQTSLAQQKLNRAQAIFAFNTADAYAHFLTTTSDK